MRSPIRTLLDTATYYLEVLWQLSVTEFRTRYFTRSLSYLWWFLEPLLLALTFYFLTRVLAGARGGALGYAEIFVGIVLWNWFRASANAGMVSMAGASVILKQIRFPPLVLLLSRVATELLNCAISLSLAFVVVLASGRALLGTWLEFPVGLLCQFLFTLGLAVWLSVIGVFLKDTVPLVNFALNLALYVSPVVYRYDQVPPPYDRYLAWNPFTAFMRAYTNTLFDGKHIDNWGALLGWCAFSLVMLVSGLAVFEASKKKFYRFL